MIDLELRWFLPTVSDELVEERYGTWGDVLLDALGAATVLLGLRGCGRWRGRW
jgi:hypothetical protein